MPTRNQISYQLALVAVSRFLVFVLILILRDDPKEGAIGQAPESGRVDPAPSRRALESSHGKILALLKEIADRTPDDNPYLGSRRARELRERLASLDQSATDRTRFELHFATGRAELNLGNLRAAIDHLSEAHRLFPISGLTAQEANRVAFQLGVAYMRLGETENCCLLNTPDSCIVPIQGGGLDNDDYLDIVTSTWDTTGQMQFIKNNRDGTFSYQTEAAGLTGLYGGLNLTSADYDNDGHLDILVLRGAWLRKAGLHPNSLLRNNGDGTFTDATFAAGLGEVHYPTQTAAWADYDSDGDLDLYVGNESSPELAAPCQLFRNNGDGTFTDVAAQAGVDHRGYVKGVSWGDYDGDRFADLYLSELVGPNRLYKNNGDGTFTDVAPRLGVTRPLASFPVWFWDFDNDGTLDLFVTSYTGRVGHLAAHHLGQRAKYEPACLYRGDGQGGFKNVTREQNLIYPILPMGSNFGDLNNDGYLDFYLGTGSPNFDSLTPNLMFLNRGGTGFDNVTMAGGFGHLQKGHGVAFADLDNDGDVDIFEQMGGAYHGDEFGDALYENPGFGNRWITIRLVGVQSNRSAIGAHIHVQIMEKGRTRSIYRHVNSGGSFGANPLRQTIGLGKAGAIEAIEVFWSKTGRTQTFRDVPFDQAIQIVEDEEQYTPIQLKKLHLHAKSEI